MTLFPDDMTLARAREVLQPLTREADGHDCPVCKQRVKLYQRSMTSVVARAVKALYDQHGREYGHMPTIVQKHLPDSAGQGGYVVLAHHWDLIEPLHTPNGDKRGFWRVTALGEAWLRGEVTVPKHVDIFDGERKGPPHGPPVNREDVLKTHFDRFGVLGAAEDGDQGDLFTGEAEAA